MKTLNINFTRINNCVNGNPRYVCHFLDFKPRQKQGEEFKRFDYKDALTAAKKLGGKKYHNKKYGGGIVFSTYNLNSLTSDILLSTGEAILYKDSKGNEKAFYYDDVLNKSGVPKKWFKLKEYGESKTYKLVK